MGNNLLLKQLKSELPKEFLITAEGISEHFIKDIAMGFEFYHVGGAYPHINTGPIEYWKYPNHIRFHPLVKYIINEYSRSWGHICQGEPGYDLIDYRFKYNKETGTLPIVVLPHISKKISKFPQLLKLINRAIDISQGKEELKFKE